MFIKLILALLLMEYASSTSAVTFNTKFSHGEKRMQESSIETSSRLETFRDEFDSHEQQKRQAICCPPITCDPDTPYRSSDGTCNNLNHPYWGASRIPTLRFLPHQYGDGVDSPRGTNQYPPLPRPRDVTASITHVVLPPTNDGISLMVMQFGQFIDHDFALTLDGEDPNCCADFVTKTPTSEECLPIEVDGDEFYGPRGVNCFPFIRTVASPCAPGPEREQVSLLTSYIDASQVYGSSSDDLVALREPNSYRMSFTPGENTACAPDDSSYPCRTFLPIRTNNVTGVVEFYGGDIRVEEQPGLTSFHNLPVRMHNDLAEVIRENNPYYSDEQVFQETRKIVGALIQQISFNEHLPIVIGTQVMDAYGLTLQPIGAQDPHFRGYDEYVDATIRSAFSTASWRFGHSLIKNFYTLPGGVQVDLSRSFNNHQRTKFFNTLPSHFLRGIAVDPAEELDHILVDAIHNFLFAEAPFDFGQDLYARNIMRSRDHGIPGYTAYRNACYPDSPVNSFSDLTKWIPEEIVYVFSSLYASVHDIDLFPAAMAEFNYPGALLGPTFTCINAEQFARMKYGDRFWFENPGIFTYSQLESIRRTKLSSLICLYTDAVELPENVFLQVSSSNPLRSCDYLIRTGVVNDITLYW